MTFAVILIALLIERFFDWSHLRRWHWYSHYQQKIANKFLGSPYVTLAFNVVPLLVVIVLLQWLLKGALFGLAEWLFQLVVFLYCLGPRNLWADTFACVNALVQGDLQTALNRLGTSFQCTGTVEASSSPSLSNQLLGQVFIAANQRIFAVVFWYLVLGPVGAVMYRALALSAVKSAKEDDTAASLPYNIGAIMAVLDWVPVRIFTCLFALGGHFVKVFSYWRKKDLLGLDANEQLITECGKAALGQEEIELTEGAAVKNAIGLVDRSLVIILVLSAIVVLLG